MIYDKWDAASITQYLYDLIQNGSLIEVLAAIDVFSKNGYTDDVINSLIAIIMLYKDDAERTSHQLDIAENYIIRGNENDPSK